jgi:hypothetical protein
VKLCNVSAQLKEALTAMQLQKVMPIYDTREQAMTAFRKKGWLSSLLGRN